MRKIAVVTDSNAGFTNEEVAALGDLYVIPMPFTIDGEEYFENINLTQQQFYEKLLGEADISTSQPSIGGITELWDKLLEKYDSLLHIPMSSGLSMSCETAKNFAREYKGRIQVVDNKRISVTQISAVKDALTLIDKGFTAEEAKNRLEAMSYESSIYIMVDTLKYLKKGGRVTPAAAAIGTILKIKPVLQIHGGKLDRFAKAPNQRVACQKMIEAMKKDFATTFKTFVDNGEMELFVAYTNCPDKADAFMEQIKAEIPNVPLTMSKPLSLSVSCHIGSGALAIACSRVVK